MRFPLLLILATLSLSTHAAESEIKAPKPEPTARFESSFEALGNDPILPVKHIGSKTNPDTTLNLMRELTDPVIHSGLPTGGQGSTLSGRTIEDAQVSTMGVPLSLPQGGGADLSLLPGFLWAGADVHLLPTEAGVSPQSASGAIDLKLRTREWITDGKKSDRYLLQGTANRQWQTLMLATKVDNAAFMAGENLGLVNGPAGSFSYAAFRDASSQVFLHVLGSATTGDVAGSAFKRDEWRLIPVLESHFLFIPGVSLSSTLFSDFTRIQTDTHKRTWQYGFENALKVGSTTLGVTGRFVQYAGPDFQAREWPLHVSLNQDFFFSEGLRGHAVLLGDYLNPASSTATDLAKRFGAGARFGLRQAASDGAWFGEISSQSKLPTLTDRQTDPNRKQEQVSAALVGREYGDEGFKSTFILKGEHRLRVQVPGAGNARLFYARHELELTPVNGIKFSNEIEGTYSRVDALGGAYPNVSRMSDRLKTAAYLGPQVKWLNFVNFTGASKTTSGDANPGYALIDSSLEIDVRVIDDVKSRVEVGVDNIANRKAQIGSVYTQPGRLFHCGLTALF
jgi:hypothetical protein